MTRKFAYRVLGIAVLMGGMAVVALADDPWMDTYGPTDPSVSSQPEQGMEQPGEGEIREPMETGAIPDSPGSSSEEFRMDTGEEPAVEIGGQLYRPGVDLGP